MIARFVKALTFALLAVFCLVLHDSTAEKLRILPASEKRLLIRGPQDLAALRDVAAALNEVKGTALLQAAGLQLRTIAAERDVTVSEEPSSAMLSLKNSLSLQSEPGQSRQRLVEAIGTLKTEMDTIASTATDVSFKKQISELSARLADAQASIK